MAQQLFSSGCMFQTFRIVVKGRSTINHRTITDLCNVYFSRGIRPFNMLSFSWSQHSSVCVSVISRPIYCDLQRHIRHFITSARSFKAIKIDGTVIAKEINDEVKSEVEALKAAGKRSPHLAVILVGSDPASVVYVKNKAKAAEYTGISCDILRIPKSVTEQELLKEIDFLNSLPDNDGILVQLPLPSHINTRSICDAVSPHKDVDGFNVLNVGRFCVDQRAFIPATPSGVLEIIRRLGIQTCGKNAVVCGRSKNVGLPIALHLHSDGNGGNNAGDATTTICHRNTPPDQLKFFTKAADIIITATGVPGLVTADMVKDGVVVIDIGITRILDARGKPKLVGDVDYESVSEKASYITPVPGGVGPVTVAMVIKNTLIAYKNEIDFGKKYSTK
uniref:methenyltetrahydrofolate cyclohydrolase n=1 Tax=Arion vulgaris TaxID=1028688 RepID=A0A0B6YBK5_9EUPU